MIDRRSFGCLLGVAGLGALLGGCDMATGDTRNETVSIDRDKADTVRVELRMGSGQLTVASGGAKLMDAAFAYNVPDWKPVVNYRGGELSVLQPSSSGSFGNTVNNWDVKLSPDVPMEITANLGAGEANLELGKLNLSRVDLNIGAGQMKVDLRGEPTRDYTAQIRGGVGETVVYLPKDAAIAATATKGIGDISTEGLENRDGIWINPDRIGAPVTVRLDVKGGVGAIRLIR